MSDVTSCFSPSSSISKGLGGGGGQRPPPVRKARPSSLVRFFSTKTGGRTRPSASRTPARNPLGTDVSEDTGTSSFYHIWKQEGLEVFRSSTVGSPYLEASAVHSWWRLTAPSVGHNQSFIGINLQRQNTWTALRLRLPHPSHTYHPNVR